MARNLALIGLARSRQPEAEQELFDLCWPIVWNAVYAIVGNRSLAEDAAQTGIVNVFRTLHRFDQARPIEPWVRRVAANAALSELRKQRNLPTPVPDPELYRDAAPASGDLELSGLLDLVSRLSEERRVVIVLSYWLDFSIAEIADLLKVPQGTVASRRARALQELRELMEEDHARLA
jgi:RNA polymerase sigma-70 factor, ECF subfamily